MLFGVKYLGHENGLNTIKQILSKNAALHKFSSATTKIKLMKFIVSSNFYSKFNLKHHVKMKPLYDLLNYNNKILQEK